VTQASDIVTVSTSTLYAAIGGAFTVISLVVAAVVQLRLTSAELHRAIADARDDATRVRALETGHAVHEQRLDAIDLAVTDLRARTHRAANVIAQLQAVCHVQHAAPPSSD